MKVLILTLFLFLLPSPLYGGVKEVCDLEKVAQGIHVVTPDVREYLIMVFGGPCELLKMGEREAAIRKLKPLSPSSRAMWEGR